jgi:hypothetical protein
MDVPNHSHIILLNKFMRDLQRKLQTTKSELSAHQIFGDVIRLRDRVIIPGYETIGLLPQRFDDLMWLGDFQDIERRISSIAKTINTRHNYIKNIISLLRTAEDSRYDPIIDHYRNLMKTTFEERDKELSENRVADHDLTWKDILAKRDAIEDKKSIEYLIMCLYTMIPPLRDDFVNMDIVKTAAEATDPKTNYYVFETKKFILNEYKTRKFDGVKTITAPDELHEVILRCRPRGGFMLPGYNGTKRIQSAYYYVSKVVGQQFGSTRLRSVFVSEYGETLIKAFENAESMCHTVLCATKYYAKTPSTS